MYPAWRILCRRTVAGVLSNAPSITKGCACFGRSVGRGVIDGSSVAGSLRPRRGRIFKQRPKHNKRLCLFRAQCWSAVIHFSSVAHSLPPHRGGVFKQRPKHNLLCLFRALSLVGGDACIQRGGFFAAASWHIFQATPSMFRALSLGGGDTFFQRGAFFAAAPWRGF
jgi:hypothetical protein